MSAAERNAFLAALAKDEDDSTTRLVYADWLDDHDQPEEADRMRRWQASKQWLTEWVRSINYDQWERDDDGEYVLDASGQRVPGKKDNPHVYQDAIEAGHAAVGGRDYCWGTDAAADYFCDDEASAEWFGHWSTVTGVAVPGEVIGDPSYRCAC